MKRKNRIILIPAAVFTALVFLPAAALATQGHGGLEGVYTHQLAHLFFIASMGILIYWIRQRNLVCISGWRSIQFAALFFIIWNLDAVLVHILDDQLALVHVVQIGFWKIRISAAYGSHALQLLYYFARLDHLLCVPAIIFLYRGLKQLTKSQGLDPAGQGQP